MTEFWQKPQVPSYTTNSTRFDAYPYGHVVEWEEVEGEIVQLLAMLIRFVTEGDQVIGITPPTVASTESSHTQKRGDL